MRFLTLTRVFNMKLEVKVNSKEVLKCYLKVLGRYHFTYDRFFFGVLRYGAFVVIPLLSYFALFTETGLNISDYVFLAVCFFGSILIRRRALSLSYIIRYFYSAKSMTNKFMDDSFKVELDDDGMIQNDNEKVSWSEMAGIEVFDNMVCIVLNPLLYQINGNFMPPIMVVIPRKSFENTTYDFESFKAFCDNVGNPNLTLSLES